MKRLHSNRWCVASLLLMMGAARVAAASAVDEPPGVTLDLPAADDSAPSSHHDVHAFHHHHFGVFLGYAVKDADKLKDGFKIGVEYEYQFIEWLGVRGFADYEAGKLDKWLFGAGTSFHVPKTGLGIFLGGGVETKGGRTDAFVRLSGEYMFELNDTWSLAPVVGYDFGRDESGAFFAGVMVGFGL